MHVHDRLRDPHHGAAAQRSLTERTCGVSPKDDRDDGASHVAIERTLHVFRAIGSLDHLRADRLILFAGTLPATSEPLDSLLVAEHADHLAHRSREPRVHGLSNAEV